MDITISKAELSKALYMTQSIVEKRTTMPILANALLSATNNKLKISATDLEVTAVSEGTAEVHSKGSTTVNAKVFADIVRELPEGDVRLKVTDGERLEIVAGNSKLRIIGLSAEEFPSLPGVGFDAKGRIASEQLLEMINKTIHAVSLDETRFNLNGICFELVADSKSKNAKQGLRMIATDGHRLAMITRPIGNLSFEGSIIVPRKGLSELRKVLEGNDQELGIGVHEGFLILDSRGTKVSIRLIDGEFPDYNQVIPKGKGVVATVETKELAQALKRVSLMVTDKAKCVRFDLNKDRMKISSSSPELGDASEEVGIVYKGEPLSIGFNAKYLLDFASSLGEDRRLCLELNGELGPGKFYLENDESYIGIVMPMRLNAD